LDALHRAKPRRRKPMHIMPGKATAPHLRPMARDGAGHVWGTADQLAHVLEVAKRRGISDEAGITGLMAELAG